MKKVMLSLGVLLVLLLSISPLHGASRQHAPQYRILSSSFMGAEDFNDAVMGARFRSDGMIVLAANLGPDVIRQLGLPGEVARSKRSSFVMVLGNAAKRILAWRQLDADLCDMALDGQDNIYLAAGQDGLIKLSADTKQVVWTKMLGNCRRVDATSGGLSAVLLDKRIIVLDAAGNETGRIRDSGYTCDVCIDGASKTVIFCGFRNAYAFDGRHRNAVQICYVYGCSPDGEKKWTNYDWSTAADSDRFLNKPTDNMADTRGDRCAVGHDGKLYVTFMVAGDNHIFRYDPKDIMKKVQLAGGDAYHQFHNSRSEHKCFVGRYEPATGDYLLGQQFCGRLTRGLSNTVITKTGDITADKTGCVYVVGRSFAGLPMNVDPLEGQYSGGGFILIMSPDFRRRLLCTRTGARMGRSHAVDAHSHDGGAYAIFGGSSMQDGMFVQQALQKKATDDAEGFFVLLKR